MEKPLPTTQTKRPYIMASLFILANPFVFIKKWRPEQSGGCSPAYSSILSKCLVNPSERQMHTLLLYSKAASGFPSHPHQRRPPLLFALVFADEMAPFLFQYFVFLQMPPSLFCKELAYWAFSGAFRFWPCSMLNRLDFVWRTGLCKTLHPRRAVM